MKIQALIDAELAKGDEMVQHQSFPNISRNLNRQNALRALHRKLSVDLQAVAAGIEKEVAEAQKLKQAHPVEYNALGFYLGKRSPLPGRN